MWLRTLAVLMCEDSRGILGLTNLLSVSRLCHGKIKKEALILKRNTTTIISSNSWISTKTTTHIRQRRTTFWSTLSSKVNTTTTTIRMSLPPSQQETSKWNQFKIQRPNNKKLVRPELTKNRQPWTSQILRTTNKGTSGATKLRKVKLIGLNRQPLASAPTHSRFTVLTMSKKR